MFSSTNPLRSNMSTWQFKSVCHKYKTMYHLVRVTIQESMTSTCYTSNKNSLITRPCSNLYRGTEAVYQLILSIGYKLTWRFVQTYVHYNMNNMYQLARISTYLSSINFSMFPCNLFAPFHTSYKCNSSHCNFHRDLMHN